LATVPPTRWITKNYPIEMGLALIDPKELLWKPLFEAAAQTMTGAVGLTLSKNCSRVFTNQTVTTAEWMFG
jgi:hypothetical protein